MKNTIALSSLTWTFKISINNASTTGKRLKLLCEDISNGSVGNK